MRGERFLGAKQNKKLIFLSGLMRSGNHAINIWISGHVGYQLSKIHANADLEKWFIYKDGNAIHRNKRKKHKFTKYDKDCDIAVVSYQNLPIRRFEKRVIIDTVPDKRDVYKIHIIRNPYNILASWFRSPLEMKNGILDIWAGYAREYLGKTNYVKGNKFFIIYDRWFVDLEYRRTISSFLGLEHSDKSFEKVDNWGDGSSFDKVAYNGRAKRMDVLFRYKKLYNNRRFRRLCKRKDIFELANKMFVLDPDLIKIIRR
jgi:hypothetical protein